MPTVQAHMKEEDRNIYTYIYMYLINAKMDINNHTYLFSRHFKAKIDHHQRTQADKRAFDIRRASFVGKFIYKSPCSIFLSGLQADISCVPVWAISSSQSQSD